MSDKAILLITVTVCTLAALMELVLSFFSTSDWHTIDLSIPAFIIGPYILLGICAWWQRKNHFTARFLLGIGVVLSLIGISCFAWDSYRYHTEPDYRYIQRMTAFIIPLLQWLIMLLITTPLGLRWLLQRWRNTKQNTE